MDSSSSDSHIVTAGLSGLAVGAHSAHGRRAATAGIPHAPVAEPCRARARAPSQVSSRGAHTRLQPSTNTSQQSYRLPRYTFSFTRSLHAQPWILAAVLPLADGAPVTLPLTVPLTVLLTSPCMPRLLAHVASAATSWVNNSGLARARTVRVLENAGALGDEDGGHEERKLEEREEHDERRA